MRRAIYLIVSFALTATAMAQAPDKAESEVIVSATSTITAEPEVADFRISIITRNENATAAFASYAGRYEALRRSVKDIIDSTRLLTDNLTVSPYFDYKKPDQVKPEYYQVRADMSLSVPVSDLNKALAGVTSVEGVTINGIEFRLRNPDKMEIEALRLAVKQARAKAEAIAGLERLADLRVKSMSTTTNRPPIGPMMRVLSAEAGAPTLMPSAVSVTATVNVTYTAEVR